jgi:hypothetical protein
VLFRSPELVPAVDRPALRVVSLFPQLVAMGVPLADPRSAFESYAHAHHMEVTRSPSGDGEQTVRALDTTGGSVTARFDAEGRLVAIDADL